MAQSQHEVFTPGSMDIREQEKTYAGFISMTKWAIGIIAVALIFLTLVGA